MRWRLKRRGGDVFGLFSVAATDLQKATFPVYVDTAIAEERVGANSDNAEDTTGQWKITYLYNMYISGYASRYTGHRWTTVPIPQGATIDSASVAFYFPSTSYDDPDAYLYMEDADNAVTFAADEGGYANRTKTASPVTCTATGVGDGFETSQDIKSIVQRVVNRGGWASDNALVLLTAPHGTGAGTYASINAIMSGTPYAAKFNCTYTEGGASAIPAIMHHYRQLRSR